MINKLELAVDLFIERVGAWASTFGEAEILINRASSISESLLMDDDVRENYADEGITVMTAEESSKAALIHIEKLIAYQA